MFLETLGTSVGGFFSFFQNLPFWAQGRGVNMVKSENLGIFTHTSGLSIGAQEGF